MEQIERALKKARHDRHLARAVRFHTDGSLNGALNGNGLAANAMPPSQCKTIQLDPSVMESHRIIGGQFHNGLTDVYRSLRTQVLQALDQRGKTTLGVTSAKHSEGKTLTAINLAIAMAMDVKHTVLLVDADLRTPGIARNLGIQPALGLSDCLTGKAEIHDCLVRSQLERLCILPARSNVGNSAELLASPRMLRLATEFKVRYPDRIIIYDLPPLLPGGDAIGFLPSVDATLLVVRDGTTKSGESTPAIELLSDRNLIGMVLNAAA